MLRAADAGEEALDAAVTEMTDTLRIAMFCAGAANVAGLFRDARLVEGRSGEVGPATVLTGVRRPHTASAVRDLDLQTAARGERGGHL